MDDLFLDTFFKEDVNQDEFFEAEISKEFEKLQSEVKANKNAIEALKRRNDLTNSEVKNSIKQIKEKESEKNELLGRFDSVIHELERKIPQLIVKKIIWKLKMRSTKKKYKFCKINLMK